MKKLLLALCLLAGPVFADEKDDKRKEALQEESKITTHTVTINGQPIPYEATAGTYIIKDDKDDKKASFFFISYVRSDVKEKNDRPITFCFNGGPGSSSIWLHMGAFGPKRVITQGIGYIDPPYRLEDNQYSILDLTDLVFIDPVSTGYSRAAPGEDPKQFHGVQEDIKSLANFIRLYVTRNGRWESPKFLAGESYGTTRAAGLANELHDDNFMYFNGVILVSSILNFQAQMDNNGGNDLPYLMYLPSYTATAWYHKKLPADLQKDRGLALKEAEQFVQGEYAAALMKGDKLDPQVKKQIIAKLARLTGLDPAYIERSRLRVNPLRFEKELLRGQNLLVGRFDSRFTGYDNDDVRDQIGRDPSADVVFGPYAATFNNYVREDLGWTRDEKYEVLANVFPWNFDYGEAKYQYLNVTGKLRDVMLSNPALRVFVASGIYDLATPYFAVDYTMDHLGAPAQIHERITKTYYDAGHMMYIHLPALQKLKADLTAYYQKTLQE